MIIMTTPFLESSVFTCFRPHKMEKLAPVFRDSSGLKDVFEKLRSPDGL